MEYQTYDSLVINLLLHVKKQNYQKKSTEYQISTKWKSISFSISILIIHIGDPEIHRLRLENPRVLKRRVPKQRIDFRGKSVHCFGIRRFQDPRICYLK